MAGPITDHDVALAELSANHPNDFALVPDKRALDQIARALDLLRLRKLSFKGQLIPRRKTDWDLSGRLGATVIQPCIVTLDPVTTRIEVPVERRFLADYHEAEAEAGAEIEMPDDENAEPLPAHIDLLAIATEALALNLPQYPRKEGADLGAAIFTEPGTAPLDDAAMKPFASLKELRDKLDESKGD